MRCTFIFFIRGKTANNDVRYFLELRIRPSILSRRRLRFAIRLSEDGNVLVRVPKRIDDRFIALAGVESKPSPKASQIRREIAPIDPQNYVRFRNVKDNGENTFDFNPCFDFTNEKCKNTTVR